MSLLSWNCRGTGGSLCSPKMLNLSRLIASTKAQVIFISETRNKKQQKLILSINLLSMMLILSRLRALLEAFGCFGNRMCPCM